MEGSGRVWMGYAGGEIWLGLFLGVRGRSLHVD